MSKLYIVCGYPGVGKSTAAEIIADQTGARPIRTDSVRKELFGPNPSYSSSESQKTYDEVFSRAKETLESGTPVALDATFNLKIGRDSAVEVAEEVGVDFQFIKVECDEDVVRKRIENRTDTDSDADFSIYQKIRDDFEPFSYPYDTVDNSTSKSNLESQISRVV